MNFALELKNVPFAKFTPVPLINVDHSSRHYDQFVSGQHCAGGTGDWFYLSLGYSNIRKKSVKCPKCLKPIVVLGITKFWTKFCIRCVIEEYGACTHTSGELSRKGTRLTPWHICTKIKI